MALADLIETGATRNFTFEPVITLIVAAGLENGFPKEFAIADFNGDGKLDALITYINTVANKATPVRLLLGDGAGGFTDSTVDVVGANPPGNVFARQIVVADFNRDGRADAFVADHGFDQPPFPGFQNTLLLSRVGGLRDGAAGLPQLSDFSHSAAAADIDGDGDIDLFVGNLGGGPPPYVLINNGSGAFTRDDSRLAGFPSEAPPSAVHLFDADGDGDADLLLGAVPGLGATLILRNDAGRFNATLSSPPIPPSVTSYQAMDINSGDLNGDGRPDLLVAYQLNNYVDGRLQVLIGRGDGTFADETAVRMAEPTNPVWIRRAQLVDLNGDGALDILLAADSDRPVYLNNGSGTFIRMPVGFTPGNRTNNVIAADLNGDGRTDLFAVLNSTLVSVRMGRDPGLTQTGGSGADGFMGDADDEFISGLAGDDVIFAGAGADTGMGGAGSDSIIGGAGQDFLRGEDGDDYIEGGDQFDDLHGNIGNDTVRGGDGGDWVVGGQGTDLLFGDDGGDVVLGNLAADTLSGGAGLDWVRGGQGNDLIDAGPGDDLVWGDRGDDTLSGGGGADTFSIFGEAGLDRVTDFNAGEGDRVRVEVGYTFTTAQVGADTVVTLSGGAQMVLAGVQLSALPAGWIVQG